MAPIRGVGLDLDHTIAIDNQLERVAFLHLLETLLSEGGRTIGTLGDEIADIDELLRRARYGDFGIEEAVRRFVAERQVQPRKRHVESFYGNVLDMVGEFVIAVPGVKSALEALRDRGIAVAILTNGWNPLQVHKARHVGFTGPVLVSSEIGAQKPSSQAFEKLLATLETEPETTLFVGDDPRSDIVGAHEASIRAVWMNWEGKKYPNDLAPPDGTISDFYQLSSLIPSTVTIS